MRRFNFIEKEKIVHYVDGLTLERRIKEIHIHHTWRPTLKMYMETKNKETRIYNMHRYHLDVRGFSEIAQHFTVVPDGIWDGRNINKIPASIKNYNTGSICIESLGDYDVEDFSSVSDAHFTLVAALMNKVLKEQGTEPKIIFHRERSGKTCPGTKIDKTLYLSKLESYKEVYKIEKWKSEGIDYLAELKIINSPKSWKRDINKPFPTWAAFLIFMRIIKYILKEVNKR